MESLQDKLTRLKTQKETDVWYLVKQELNFMRVATLVNEWKKWKDSKSSLTIADYIEGSRLTDTNYRALTNAYNYGLMRNDNIVSGTSSKPSYKVADSTPVWEELSKVNFADVNAISNIIDRQIEKLYISNPYDDESKNIRKSYRLFIPYSLLPSSFLSSNWNKSPKTDATFALLISSRIIKTGSSVSCAYCNAEENIPFLYSKVITLPSNLYIIGTVNTSDQNVFAMDTAFKRRFIWKYKSTDVDPNTFKNNPDIKLFKEFNIDWYHFYTTINTFITDNLNLSEDKQVGPYFIKFNTNNDSKIHSLLRDKLLQYLWEDVDSIARNNYSNEDTIFSKDIKSFSTLYEKFDNQENIFSDTLTMNFETKKEE